MTEWKKVKLGDVVTKLGDGIHGTPKYTQDGEYAFINGNNLENNQIVIKSDTKRVDESEFLKYKKELNKRTLFVSINGTIGNVAKYNNEKIILGKSACYLNINENYNKDFMFYILKSPMFQQYIETYATGTTIKNVSLKLMRDYELSLPPLHIQKKIAEVLSCLDAQIELNHRINENLEQQAQAIFKEWFVDNAMPEKEKTIGDYITPKRGKNLLSKDAVFGDVPVVAGGLEPATYHNISNTNSPVLTISSSGANAGFVRLWNIPVWSSDSCFIDSTMSNNVYFWYVLLKLRQQEIYDSQTGSAQPHIYPQHIANLKITELNQELIEKYTKTVTPFFEKIGANQKENQTLAQIRDTLLPKLMNGELEV